MRPTVRPFTRALVAPLAALALLAGCDTGGSAAPTAPAARASAAQASAAGKPGGGGGGGGTVVRPHVVKQSLTVPAGGLAVIAAARCPAGEVAIGGGFKSTAGPTGVVLSSMPEYEDDDLDLPTGWFVVARATDVGFGIVAYAVCEAR